MRGVATRHIEEWIALGVTKPLRFGEHRLVSRARPQHLAQDVIARPVEDARHAADNHA